MAGWDARRGRAHCNPALGTLRGARPLTLGGLRVVLLDVVWTKAGESLPDGVRTAHLSQARKNGSEARNRRVWCAVRRLCSFAWAQRMRRPAPLGTIPSSCCGRTRRRPNNTGDDACALLRVARMERSAIRDCFPHYAALLAG